MSGWRIDYSKGQVGDLWIKHPGIRPCGRCLGCLLDAAYKWAMRGYHESLMHDQNTFITLTYRPEDLPEDNSVSKDELQRFFKRLRKKIAYKGTMPRFSQNMKIQYYVQPWHKKYRQPKEQYVYRPISYISCGEYGKRGTTRPHYHACIFGFDFPDKELLRSGAYRYHKNRFSTTPVHALYTSPMLEKIWGKGFVTIGEVTIDSVGYVARYTMKKIFGKIAQEHYGNRNPEFALMSRNPGVGKRFYERFKSDIYPKDFITVNGFKKRPPVYYDNLLRQEDPLLWRKIKTLRQDHERPILPKERKRLELFRKIVTTNLKRDMENAE